ncbi:MAG: ABC transporter substrate-binding protein [Anaerolineaceae bacterium]|nr:ABC transporter substrate-binding protein [Anaerolineaceae bacterium]
MKRSKYYAISIVLVMFIGTLVGCAAPASPTATPEVVPTDAPAVAATEAPSVEVTQSPIIVTDALGRTVEFSEHPQRIVMIGKGTTLLANSAFMFSEAQDRVIAYELRLQMPDRNFVKSVFPKTENVTLLVKDAGPEQVAPLNPDLVIIKSYNKEKLGNAIEALGVNVIYLDLESTEQFYQDIYTLGQIFGNDARAEEIVALYKANETRIADGLNGLSDADKPSILLLSYSDKGGTVAFAVPPMEWLQTVLVQNAGGDPAWKDAISEGGWTVVSLEQIAAWNADMVFIVDYSGKAMDVVAQLKADANWQALDAVINNQIYAFPVDFLSWDQADPRWGLGELWLAAKIHPDRFEGLNFTEEISEFYKTYYGLEDTTIIEKVMPLVSGDL